MTQKLGRMRRSNLAEKEERLKRAGKSENRDMHPERG